MKTAEQTPEAAMKAIQKIFRNRGTKALTTARNEMLQEPIECKEAKQAITYFMTKYWHDLARPALLSLACEAMGGNPETTTPFGVPMILISGALSIHDDIIDQTRAKAGYPTVYGKFGKDIALLVGDALLFKGFSLLNNIVAETGLPVARTSLITGIIKSMFFELGDAEAMELLLRGRVDVLPERYLEIVRKKAADVEAHTRIGAVVGGGSIEEIELVGQVGRILGMMIILRDDWIDLIDLDESRHRVEHESLPLPILYGLRDPQVSPKLKPLLQHKPIRRRDAQAILETLQGSEALNQYVNLMHTLARSASSKLKQVKHDRVQHLELLIKATLPPSIEFEATS